MNWKFINTGCNTGLFNMMYDAHLAETLRQNESTPTLRVYGWRPHAISIGYHQQFSDFDSEKLRNARIDIVRRPTGGRAILHAGELTYSVVLRIEERGLKEIYRFINEGLLSGLRLLGVDAELTIANDNFRHIYREEAAVSCFTSSAKSEIQFGGKKLVGSAQRRFHDVVLQHGSLLLNSEHRRIIEFMAGITSESRSSTEQELIEKTIDLETILGRPISFEEVADFVKRGFEKGCGVTFTNCLTAESIALEHEPNLSRP